jgi:aspartate/methionine/tyrosine aminotransferase
MMPFLSPEVVERLSRIEPFHAMEVLKHAGRLQAAGRDIVTLALGEPQFDIPDAVQHAAMEAMRRGQTGYTAALGLDALRSALSSFYARHYGLEIDASRIIVTAGASGALLLACAALFGPGDDVLMPDPCYPCNRHFVAAFGARAALVPTSSHHRFAMTADQAREHWTPATRAALIASPSNPTGTSTPIEDLREIHALTRARGATLIVDEIYQGLSYEGLESATGFPPSALSLGDDIVSINSFSKFFGMTGWRLGWLVVPPPMVPTIEKLAQNLFICASTVSQRAALACFSEASMAIYLDRREQFRAHRDRLLPAFAQMGLEVPAAPDGAFYLYADISAHLGHDMADSEAFCRRALEDAGVVLVPGRDFGPAHARQFVRASFAGSSESIDAAIERLAAWLDARGRRPDGIRSMKR